MRHKKTKKELYFSFDIEADGPIPGPNSMLSLGVAAFTEDGKRVDTFSANLHLLEGATPDPDTMEWWKKQPDAWEACRKDLQSPSTAMNALSDWIAATCRKTNTRAVFVGYPATYDFMFVYWYLIRFTGRSPFSHSGLDIKTLAFAMLKKGYRVSTKKYMPRRWFSKHPHNHVAVDDAIGQGDLFCNMLRELRNG
jgi:hypothetical protein